MIEVDVGDTVVEFPDDTPPDVMKAALQKRFASKPEPPAQFDQRFASAPSPANAGALQSGLEERARLMTTADPVSRPQQLATDFMNQGSAASQGTTPNIHAQTKNLISTEAFESDAGEVQFRDPATGQVVTTDKNKHVALRDPADGRVKIYARTEGTDEGRLSAAGRLLGTGMASGAPTARPGLPAVSNIQPKASDIFATAKPYYRAFTDEAKQIAVPTETAAGIGERLRTAIRNKANLIEEQAPEVYAATKILDKGEPLLLDELQNIKQVIGSSFQSPNENVRKAAAAASRELAKVMSEVSPEAAASLKTADSIHSTARAVQELQRKGDVADLRAGRAGYGGNAVNSMRQVLSPIVQRAVEGKTTAFKPDEIQAMRDIVEGTTATNALRGVGQASPSKGAIQTYGAGATALAAGPVALVIPALGAASNKLATVLTGKQIDSLKEMVARRSPAYADAVAKAVERYERTQAELATKPTASKLASYLSASRALSAGLTRDGVSVSSGDLMRAIQGPVRAPADEEQR